MNNRTMVMAAALALLAVRSPAGDWPQFGGPDRNNVSGETGLADRWPAGGPPVLWEKTVAEGYAAPSVQDGKVYLVDRLGDLSLLRCLELTSGKELWSCSFDDPGKMEGTRYEGTRGIPTLTAEAAYLVTGYGTFVCIDLTTHKIRWMHNFIKDYGISMPMFGIAQSPFLYGKLVLVAPNAPQAAVAAYDAASGERVWVSQGLGMTSYVSPTVAKFCGQDMVLAIGSRERDERSERGRPKKGESKKQDEGAKQSKDLLPGTVAGLSPQDGSTLWTYQDWQCQGAIPFPVPVEGDRLFITGGYDAGSVMLRVVKSGGGFAVKELFREKDIGAQIHQPIRIGDFFYIAANSNSARDGLVCLSLDGQLKWRTKDVKDAPNYERGGLILADGKLIMLDGKTGRLHLVKPDPSGYRELAAAPMVKENDMAWAPLVLSDGRLLVRDWTTLKCIDLR